jgi:hypothetical protein
MGGAMDSRVRKDDGTMGLNGRSGRLTAKQNARYPTLRDEAVAPTRDPSRRAAGPTRVMIEYMVQW